MSSISSILGGDGIHRSSAGANSLVNRTVDGTVSLIIADVSGKGGNGDNAGGGLQLLVCREALAFGMSVM